MRRRGMFAHRISGAINGVLAIVAVAAMLGAFCYGMYTLVRDRLLPLLGP